MTDPVEDAEANHFAMCLLMPAEFLRRDLREMGGIDLDDGKAVAKLAKRYGVSPTLMAARIGWLVYQQSRQRVIET